MDATANPTSGYATPSLHLLASLSGTDRIRWWYFYISVVDSIRTPRAYGHHNSGKWYQHRWIGYLLPHLTPTAQFRGQGHTRLEYTIDMHESQTASDTVTIIVEPPTSPPVVDVTADPDFSGCVSRQGNSTLCFLIQTQFP